MKNTSLSDQLDLISSNLSRYSSDLTKIQTAKEDLVNYTASQELLLSRLKEVDASLEQVVFELEHFNPKATHISNTGKTISAKKALSTLKTTYSKLTFEHNSLSQRRFYTEQTIYSIEAYLKNHTVESVIQKLEAQKNYLTQLINSEKKSLTAETENDAE